MPFSSDVNDCHAALARADWLYDNGWHYEGRSWSAYVHNRIRASQGTVVLLMGDYDSLRQAFEYEILYYPELGAPIRIAVGFLSDYAGTLDIERRTAAFLLERNLWPPTSDLRYR